MFEFALLQPNGRARERCAEYDEKPDMWNWKCRLRSLMAYSISTHYKNWEIALSIRIRAQSRNVGKCQLYSHVWKLTGFYYSVEFSSTVRQSEQCYSVAASWLD